MEKFIATFIGIAYEWHEYLTFIAFTIIGMTLVKLIRYNIRKKKAIAEGTVWKLSFKKWFDDNSLDFIIAFIASFITMRFIGDILAHYVTNLPKFTDVMMYGLVLGLGYQYVFHKLMNKVTVIKTIDKLK